MSTAIGAARVLTPRRQAWAAQSGGDLRLGLIGCGNRSSAFLEHVVAVCDPDKKRLAKAANLAKVSADAAFTDMRSMLERKDLDAVIIAAPDHWHTPAALLALTAGKHAYVEKPISHNFYESQRLVAAAARTGLVVQHGTQQRSSRFMQSAIDRLLGGLIGDILVAKAWNIQRRDDIGHAEPSAPPQHLDYDMWVGPAEMVPFQSNRFHTTWHWWHNFGTGDIGNDGAHEIDYARWGLGIQSLPSKITAVAGKYFFHDDQQFPDTATCVFEYANQQGATKTKQLIFEMRLWSRSYPYNCDSGVEFYGTKGMAFLSKRGKFKVFGPKNTLIVDQRREPTPRNGRFAHLEDFLNAIRTGTKPIADVEEAHRSVAPIHLANIAIRVGRSLHFDPKTETIMNDEPASKHMQRTYRHGGHWAALRDA